MVDIIEVLLVTCLFRYPLSEISNTHPSGTTMAVYIKFFLRPNLIEIDMQSISEQNKTCHSISIDSQFTLGTDSYRHM